MKTKTPAPLETATGEIPSALKPKGHAGMQKIPTNPTNGKPSDFPPATLFLPFRPTAAESLAARRIAERTGFSPSLSATVATLAMLGGAR